MTKEIRDLVEEYSAANNDHINFWKLARFLRDRTGKRHTVWKENGKMMIEEEE